MTSIWIYWFESCLETNWICRIFHGHWHWHWLEKNEMDMFGRDASSDVNSNRKGPDARRMNSFLFRDDIWSDSWAWVDREREGGKPSIFFCLLQFHLHRKERIATNPIVDLNNTEFWFKWKIVSCSSVSNCIDDQMNAEIRFFADFVFLASDLSQRTYSIVLLRSNLFCRLNKNVVCTQAHLSLSVDNFTIFRNPPMRDELLKQLSTVLITLLSLNSKHLFNGIGFL